eukprot:Lithocolla_globosa_v1_NODE_8503_length_813_cov_2.150396.p1 type:complete len:217 gc:universal NODE_8503_length_813_cov_2.150396:811-161(-)
MKQDIPPTDDFDWTRLNGSTPSGSTGPDFDHSSGNGYYLYTEANGPSGLEIAIITTPILTVSGPTDLEVVFWHHMYGWDQGTLTVSVVEGFDTTEVWTRQGQQYNDWLGASVIITVNSDFQLQFKQNQTYGNRGDCAIDDILIQTVQPTTAADGFDCSFEGTQCGFSQSTEDDFEWNWGQGSTAAGSSTGPAADHSYQNETGSYLFVESSFDVGWA